MTSESGTLFFWLVLACLASITLALGILGWPTSGLVTARRASPSIGLAPGARLPRLRCCCCDLCRANVLLRTPRLFAV